MFARGGDDALDRVEEDALVTAGGGVAQERLCEVVWSDEQEVWCVSSRY